MNVRKSSRIIGRRTKTDVLKNKCVRKDEHGKDIFEDYWTDESGGESTINFKSMMCTSSGSKHTSSNSSKNSLREVRRSTRVLGVSQTKEKSNAEHKSITSGSARKHRTLDQTDRRRTANNSLNNVHNHPPDSENSRTLRSSANKKDGTQEAGNRLTLHNRLMSGSASKNKKPVNDGLSNFDELDQILDFMKEGAGEAGQLEDDALPEKEILVLDSGAEKKGDEETCRLSHLRDGLHFTECSHLSSVKISEGVSSEWLENLAPSNPIDALHVSAHKHGARSVFSISRNNCYVLSQDSPGKGESVEKQSGCVEDVNEESNEYYIEMPEHVNQPDEHHSPNLVPSVATRKILSISGKGKEMKDGPNIGKRDESQCNFVGDDDDNHNDDHSIKKPEFMNQPDEHPSPNLVHSVALRKNLSMAEKGKGMKDDPNIGISIERQSNFVEDDDDDDDHSIEKAKHVNQPDTHHSHSPKIVHSVALRKNLSVSNQSRRMKDVSYIDRSDQRKNNSIEEKINELLLNYDKRTILQELLENCNTDVMVKSVSEKKNLPDEPHSLNLVLSVASSSRKKHVSKQGKETKDVSEIEELSNNSSVESPELFNTEEIQVKKNSVKKKRKSRESRNVAEDTESSLESNTNEEYCQQSNHQETLHVSNRSRKSDKNSKHKDIEDDGKTSGCLENLTTSSNPPNMLNESDEHPIYLSRHPSEVGYSPEKELSIHPLHKSNHLNEDDPSNSNPRKNPYFSRQGREMQNRSSNIVRSTEKRRDSVEENINDLSNCSVERSSHVNAEEEQLEKNSILNKRKSRLSSAKNLAENFESPSQKKIRKSNIELVNAKKMKVKEKSIPKKRKLHRSTSRNVEKDIESSLESNRNEEVCRQSNHRETFHVSNRSPSSTKNSRHKDIEVDSETSECLENLATSSNTPNTLDESAEHTIYLSRHPSKDGYSPENELSISRSLKSNHIGEDHSSHSVPSADTNPRKNLSFSRKGREMKNVSNIVKSVEKKRHCVEENIDDLPNHSLERPDHVNAEEMQQKKKSVPKRRKPSKRTAKNLAGDFTSPSQNKIRKSSRQKYAPLDHWRNERLQYRFEKGEIKVLGVAQGTREDKGALMSMYKCSEPKVKHKRVKSKISNLYDKVSEKKISLKLSRTYSSSPWDPDLSDKPYKIKKLFVTNTASFGFIEIDGLGTKRTQYMPDEDLHMTVMTGNLEVTIQENKISVSEKDMFIVPSSTAYSLKNLGTRKALVSFVVGKFKFLESARERECLETE